NLVPSRSGSGGPGPAGPDYVGPARTLANGPRPTPPRPRPAYTPDPPNEPPARCTCAHASRSRRSAVRLGRLPLVRPSGARRRARPGAAADRDPRAAHRSGGRGAAAARRVHGLLARPAPVRTGRGGRRERAGEPVSDVDEPPRGRAGGDRRADRASRTGRR